MEDNKITYETGATSYAVNDLIFLTDNTRELAEYRDKIYKHHASLNISPMPSNFNPLFKAAKSVYRAEFGFKNSIHIKNIKEAGIDEYCQLYANDFNNWKLEHGY